MRDQSSARFIQVVFRRRKLFRCEFCRRKHIGAFAGRLDFFCIKFFVNSFCLSLPDFKVLTHRMISQKIFNEQLLQVRKGTSLLALFKRIFCVEIIYNKYQCLLLISVKIWRFWKNQSIEAKKKSKFLSISFLDPAKFVSLDLGCNN